MNQILNPEINREQGLLVLSRSIAFSVMVLLGGGLIALVFTASVDWFYPTIAYAIAAWIAWGYFASYQSKSFRYSAAAFLLELDKAFLSVREGRLQAARFMGDVMIEVDREYAGASQASRTESLKRVARDRLHRMMLEQSDEYVFLNEYLGLFETLGLVVKNGYVPVRDVVGLHRTTILNLEIYFKEHIEDLQKTANAPGLYEHLLYLVERAKLYDRAEQ